MQQSGVPMTLASEVYFNIPMTSLPVGGIITLMACGMITVRSAVVRLRPYAAAASD